MVMYMEMWGGREERRTLEETVRDSTVCTAHTEAVHSAFGTGGKGREGVFAFVTSTTSSSSITSRAVVRQSPSQ